MPAAVAGPLAGLRVVEFGQIAAGPFAGSLLADLGADVVKVEQPGRRRRHAPVAAAAGRRSRDAFSENFASLNRNKRSDRARPEGSASDGERARALCARPTSSSRTSGRA